jgi:hypothetical protein
MNNRVVLIIGNGFDLELGFKTRYSDFAKSEEWNRMYEGNVKKSNFYSLLKYLNDKKEEHSWFDIEQALLDYSSIRTRDIWHHDIATDKREYALICNTLEDYLNKQFKGINGDIDNKYSTRLLRQIYRHDSLDKKLYTFNYTPIDIIATAVEVQHLFPKDINYVHGEVKDHTLILGIDIHSLDEIIPEYSFLIKTNSNSYKATNIESDMINSRNVIIFGHSLNMIDAVYFDDYLKDLSVNKEEDRWLTIITYNENSKLQILDNIRRMGISVPKLFSHGHLEFILTESINSDNNKSFEELLSRI